MTLQLVRTLSKPKCREEINYFFPVTSRSLEPHRDEDEEYLIWIKDLKVFKDWFCLYLRSLHFDTANNVH